MSHAAHDTFATLPEYRIGIVGAKSSGKSTLMVASAWQLTREFAQNNDLEIGFGSDEEERVYREYEMLLEKGLPIQKTLPVPILRAFTISIKPPDGKGCRICLYDAAGEDFEVEERLATHPLETYDALLIIVDPFAEEGILRGVFGQCDPTEIQVANPAPVQASEILARLVNVLERVSLESVHGTFLLPLGVVVTKMDACNLAKHLHVDKVWMKHSFCDHAIAAYIAELYSPRTREFLSTLGLGNFIRIVETRFARVAYFPVSALGRSASAKYSQPFEPFGVLAPLMWLCYQTDALTDRDAFELWVKRAGTGFRGRLRGVRGSLAYWLAWGGLTCALCLWIGSLAVVILCIAKVLPPTFMLTGFLQCSFFGLLPMILYYQWVRRRFQD